MNSLNRKMIEVNWEEDYTLNSQEFFDDKLPENVNNILDLNNSNRNQDELLNFYLLVIESLKNEKEIIDFLNDIYSLSYLFSKNRFDLILNLYKRINNYSKINLGVFLKLNADYLTYNIDNLNLAFFYNELIKILLEKNINLTKKYYLNKLEKIKNNWTLKDYFNLIEEIYKIIYS